MRTSIAATVVLLFLCGAILRSGPAFLRFWCGALLNISV